MYSFKKKAELRCLLEAVYQFGFPSSDSRDGNCSISAETIPGPSGRIGEQGA